MKYKLINIGRQKVCREVTVFSEDALHREVAKHLMSNDVDLYTEDDGKTYSVIVGGLRSVGTVELLEDEFDLSPLKIDDQIIVSFGAHGTQKALVCQSVREGKHGPYIKARKYQASTKNWTKPIQVYAGEVLRMDSKNLILRGSA